MLIDLLRRGVCAFALGLFAAALGAQPSGTPFDLKFEGGKLVSLKRVGDKYPTDYIAPNAHLGAIHLAYRTPGGDWQTADADGFPPSMPGSRAYLKVGERLGVFERFETMGPKLEWTFGVKNLSSVPIEIGDLATPFPMNGRFTKQNGPTASVLKHSFISGDGSFIFWMRPNSVGPYLLMTPLPGTTPEYWDAQRGQYQVYVHSQAAGEIAKQHGTRWRIPETGLRLAPGESKDYGYVFRWATSYQDVRDKLAASGSLDVQVVPGMTVPSDLDTQIAIRSAERITGIDPEFPAQTRCERTKTNGQTTIYRVKFNRLGENRLTVRYGDGRRAYLEFFSTEPVETLIEKRAAFLAKCSYHVASKWYNGLISEWNMNSRTLLGPDNYDLITGWRIYEVSCDDPGLGKPAFLAAKNAEYPNQHEVEVLDDYIEHFVWGGLQQTTSEPYPFGIYGIPDWKTNRESKKKPHDGTEHIWRCYDYPHIVLLYDSMYRLAAGHPEIHTRLPALEYLKRALGTAQAMFTVPKKVDGWSAYETGFYNECSILHVIDDLKRNGLSREAGVLQKFWDDKTRFFTVGRPDLFGSEYAFDSTGFESTEYLAANALSRGSELGIPHDAARKFLDAQIRGNVFCRGWLEPAYYYLGSDYRGGAGNGYTLSYMSQMGGYGVLDYGLHYASDASPYVRLGYASILSSWALMNTGTASSNYGFWYPGRENDGGAGGGFEPAPYGRTWLDQPHHRGSWYYGCEIDLGFSGALRAAATIVTNDPIFGRICLGGSGRSVAGAYRFVPKDGLRKRLFIRCGSVHADVTLDGARFAAGREIALDTRSGSLSAALVFDSSLPASLSLSGLPAGRWEVSLGGRSVGRVSGDAASRLELRPGTSAQLLEVRRIG